VNILRYGQGSLVNIGPGEYVKLSKSTNAGVPFMSLPDSTQAILVELQGKDYRTNENCWSALVNNDLLLVWEKNFLDG
jgi:hypothetical protein